MSKHLLVKTRTARRVASMPSHLRPKFVAVLTDGNCPVLKGRFHSNVENEEK